MRFTARACLWAAVLSLFPARAFGAKLDLNLDYRLRGRSYKNVELSPSGGGIQAFFSHQASLGFAIKNIELDGARGKAQTMDVALSLKALGIAGSTTPVRAPFDRIADRYPNSNFIPWIQNAYIKFHNVRAWEMTFGQQPFRLGSGFLLSDDGLGFMGFSAQRSLPWKNIKTQLFFFSPRPDQAGSENIDLFGAYFQIPTEGVWQFSLLREHDRHSPSAVGVALNKAVKNYLSMGYSLEHRQFAFDGEFAAVRGKSSPSAAGSSDMTIIGHALMVKGSWKQDLGRFGSGTARLTFGRGSGDNPNTADKDESFLPSFGHRFDGLDRSGIGEFYAASLYDARASTSTFNGLPAGASGLSIVGIGLSLPPWRDVHMDLDYYLYQASRSTTGNRSLGKEWDFRLRYNVKDKLTLQASISLFRSGLLLGPGEFTARKYFLEVSGRF